MTWDELRHLHKGARVMRICGCRAVLISPHLCRVNITNGCGDSGCYYSNWSINHGAYRHRNVGVMAAPHTWRVDPVGEALLRVET